MAERQHKNNKLIKFLKKVLPLIGIVVFVYLIIDIGPDKILTTFSEISPIVFILVLVLAIPRILLNNYIWQIILRKQKIKLSYLKSLKILLIGRFYSHISPGQLGVFSKLLYMKDTTKEPLGKLFVNNLVKEVLSSFSFYFILLFSAFFIVDQYPVIFLGVILYMSLSVLFYTYFVKKERGEKTFKVLIKYLIPKRLKSYTTRFTETFYNDFPRTKDLISPFVLGIFVQIISLLQLYIIALFLRVEVPFFIFIVFFSIAGIIGALPISIGGLGTREATLVVLFSSFNVEPYTIVTISLVRYLLSGILTGCTGLSLALLEARNHKKPSGMKRPIFLPKEYFKQKIMFFKKT